MAAYQAISADSHINEPPNVWQDFVPARFKDRAPRMVRLASGDAWAIDGGPPAPIAGVASAAGKTPEQIKLGDFRFDEERPGGHEPRARVEDQKIDGLDAEVLYGGGLVARIQEPELRQVCYRAYNDWMADFCAVAP